MVSKAVKQVFDSSPNKTEIIIWKYWKTIKNIKKPLIDTNT